MNLATGNDPHSVNRQQPANHRKPVVFGRHQHLTGIVTTPGQGYHSDTGLVMVTAGMLPSAGPYRLHVRLAETLAMSGVASLRFDLSGIGESLGIGGSEDPKATDSLHRAASEIEMAMNSLGRETGVKNFILYGLCSGADDAVQAACQDSRVRGLILVDGCGYPTARFRRRRWLGHYGYRLTQPVVWKRRLLRVLGLETDQTVSLPIGFDIREFPDRATATEQFQRLLDRDVRIHFIYTGGVGEYYNYADQVWDMLPDVQWRDLASRTFFPKMDHVAMLCEDRERLLGDVVSRVNDWAPEPRPVAPIQTGWVAASPIAVS